MREYTPRIESKRFQQGHQKDALLALIAGEVARRRMTHRDVQALYPTLSARQLSEIRAGERTVGSVTMLENLARALGLPVPNESLEAA